MKSFQIVKMAVFGVILSAGVEAASASVIYSFSTINVPGATGTVPQGINNSGQIVGFLQTFPIPSFLYSNGSFTTFTYPGGTGGTETEGINNSSQIVGAFGEFGGAPVHGFIDTSGNFTAIDYPGSVGFTAAHGINDSGQIAGTFYDGTTSQGFLDTGGSFTAITNPGAACHFSFACGTFVTGINNSGEIVGFFGDVAGLIHGFVYSGGSFTTIDYPGLSCVPGNPGTGGPCGTFVTGINNSGEIGGTVRFLNGFTNGFLDIGGSFTTIVDPNNPDSTSANGINDSGQIVGSFGPTQSPNGFLATPVPEPSSLPILAGCLIGLFAMAYRGKPATKHT